jgi:prepilin-type N-terminal cleavage/methylation domain-containing protein
MFPMPHGTPIRSTHQGFTLLEVLIATVILAIGTMAIMWAFTSGLYVTTDVEGTDLALNIAQAKMEQLKNTAFANLSDSGPTTDPNFPNYNVTVNVAEGQNPMQIDTTVAWNVKGGGTNFTLTTLIANYSTQ